MPTYACATVPPCMRARAVLPTSPAPPSSTLQQPAIRAAAAVARLWPRCLRGDWGHGTRPPQCTPALPAGQPSSGMQLLGACAQRQYQPTCHRCPGCAGCGQHHLDGRGRAGAVQGRRGALRCRCRARCCSSSSAAPFFAARRHASLDAAAFPSTCRRGTLRLAAAPLCACSRRGLWSGTATWCRTGGRWMGCRPASAMGCAGLRHARLRPTP